MRIAKLIKGLEAIRAISGDVEIKARLDNGDEYIDIEYLGAYPEPQISPLKVLI